MRLPRPQLSIRTCLFALAIVAINCMIYRYECEKADGLDADTMHSVFPEGFVAGVIPLLNVAIIGSIIYVTRRLRSRGRNSATRPQSPAGVTYFSLHFLAIWCLAAVFMLDTAAIEKALQPVVQCIPEDWLQSLTEFESPLPEALFVSVVLGIGISGPALLLSWIGGVLARRCRATMTGRRFRMISCVVSIGFACVALAIAFRPQSFADHTDIELNFRIIDNASHQPITAAFLRITDVFDSSSASPCSLTGPDGRARLVVHLPAFGERNAFHSMGRFSPWGRWLELSAPRFQTVRIALPEVLGPHVDLNQSYLQTVNLTAGKTPESSFREIAGCYTQSRGMGGEGFRIEPDGRFAWSTSGCTLQYKEYGYLKRTTEMIELVTIADPGNETHPLMAWKFRVVEWGNRLYFSANRVRELQKFCRASLTPNHPANNGPPEYCRDSDVEKPQTGLPRLPARVWVSFLLDEMSLQNKRGRFRLALESFLERSTHNPPRSPERSF